MAGAAPPAGAGEGDDDYVYEGVELQTAEDYKQHRKVQAILDAQETVLDRRDLAYEYYWENRISRDDYYKAIRMAVERYLMLSKQAIRESNYAQWFWEGEPPTMRGRSPFDADGNLVAVRADKTIERDGRTYTAEELVKAELDPKRSASFRVTKPVLRLDGDGNPIFGTERNVLGRLGMPEVGRQLVFRGLQSYWEAEDPIVRKSESVEEHPMRLRESKESVHRYQVPEDVSIAAFDQINEFWWLTGMSVKLDRGQTIIKDFDMSHNEKYVHTDGAPPA